MTVNNNDSKVKNYNAPEVKNFNLSESIIKLLQAHPVIKTLALIDSRINENAITALNKLLTHPPHYIIGLSFKYCFLDTKSLFLISQALEINRTLVKLDLSCNGLSPVMGIYIVKSLKNNVTLAEINLSKNCLNDDFAEGLAELLKVNETLWKVDIAFNPIGGDGAKALLKVIRENNDSIESLGDEFESNSASMGVVNIQEIIKILRQNRVSKEVRSKMLYEGKFFFILIHRS
jgi:Ran GTPase-activating protein (RanGAP) involved in mRNA processing and transport